MNKLSPFAKQRGVETWNGVNDKFLTDYVKHFEGENAGSTIRQDVITIAGVQKWLLEANHLSGVEPVHLKLRKVESQSAYCYTSCQIRAMVVFCQAQEQLGWLANIIVALACTGLRISELATITWSDLDLDDEQLMLTYQSGQIETDSVQNRQTKNGRSRSFPIHPDLLQVLRHMGTEKGPVFRGPRGGKLHDKTARGIFVSDVIAPLAPQFPKVQGLKTFADARFHSFRHYFVRPVLMKAVPERMVMKWLGHSKSEMIRHYYHLHDEDAKRCMRNIDFLGGASGCSIGETESDKEKEDAGPAEPEKRDNLDD